MINCNDQDLGDVSVNVTNDHVMNELYKLIIESKQEFPFEISTDKSKKVQGFYNLLSEYIWLCFPSVFSAFWSVFDL